MGVTMNDENAVQNLQNGESNEDIKASLRPWSRYFAKSIDSVILFFIAGTLFLGGGWLGFTLKPLMFVLFVLAAVVFFALEAIQISSFGTTVGKFMFGITVFKQNGALLSFDESLKRTFLSWLRSGFGLPLVSLIMYIYQYNQLMKNNVTSWDKELKVLVKCPEVKAWKWLVVVPIWFVLLVAQSIAIKLYERNVDNQSLSTPPSNANQPVAVNTNSIPASAQTSEPSEQTLQQAAALFEQGNSATANGNFQQAVHDYTQVIALNPNHAGTYVNRGSAYANLKDYSSAIRDYTQAIALNPNDAMAYDNRGNAYSELKDHSSAIRDYTQAIALNPNDAQAYYNRGTAYGYLKDYSSSIRDFTQAIALDPNKAEAYVNRGSAYSELKDYSSAIRDSTQAIAINPNLAQAYYNRAISLALKNDYRNATRDARKACSLGECKALEILGEKGWLRD